MSCSTFNFHCGSGIAILARMGGGRQDAFSLGSTNSNTRMFAIAAEPFLALEDDATGGHRPASKFPADIVRCEVSSCHDQPRLTCRSSTSPIRGVGGAG